MSDNLPTSVQVQPWQPNRTKGWQCPWSKCFPQLYLYYDEPCTKTPFPDFRSLNDHIWRYHSNLLSCNKCDHRFTYAKRTEKHRQKLEEEKRDHDKMYHSSNTDKEEKRGNKCKHKRQKKERTKTKDPVETMTLQQDKSFKKWQDDHDKQGKDHAKYNSLYRCLFGDGIPLPENPYYDYLVYEHTVNPSSWSRGQDSLEYVRNHGPQSGLNHQALSKLDQQPLVADVYSLDDQRDAGLQPEDWSIRKGKPTDDSGYVSKSPAPKDRVAELAAHETETSGPHIEHGWLLYSSGNATTYPTIPNDHLDGGTGDIRPEYYDYQQSVDQFDWDMESSPDGSSG
ncbi:hypothetical protein F4779DRAFT_605886 [Xylariaceae sp. FL0662B]|nr:hypothetical protein F4779DRAFT_605886 [Xylariaceae sp. FL0662B]